MGDPLSAGLISGLVGGVALTPALYTVMFFFFYCCYKRSPNPIFFFHFLIFTELATGFSVIWTTVKFDKKQIETAVTDITPSGIPNFPNSQLFTFSEARIASNYTIEAIPCDSKTCHPRCISPLVNINWTDHDPVNVWVVCFATCDVSILSCGWDQKERRRLPKSY